MDSTKDPMLPKPPVSDPPSDPDTAGLVYGFPVDPPPLPATEEPPLLKDRSRRSSNRGSPVPTQSDEAGGAGAAARAVKLWCDWELCCPVLSLVALMAILGFLVYVMMILGSIGDRFPRVFVSDVSLSSFAVSPSSRQLNGTWRVEFSLLYKAPASYYFSCGGAAASVYYKGAYLAGTDLHAFLMTPEHPIQLEVNVDASRRDVPDWLARDLTEARRLGVVELEVQFVAEHRERRATYLCGGLRLGFSTAEEAKLIGDGDRRCPVVAWEESMRRREIVDA